MDTLYYLNLIPSEYRLKPNFIQWLNKAITLYQDNNACAIDIIKAFDLDTATGNQLDIIGIILGRSRQLYFQPPDNFSAILDDNAYRTLLRAKIVWNQWKGSIPELYTLWDIVLPENELIVLDNQDMTMDVFISGKLTDIEKQLIRHNLIIPKPQSVRINYVIVEDEGDLPIFAYRYNTTRLAGYTAHWVFDSYKFTNKKIFGYGEETNDIAGYSNGQWMYNM